MENTKGQNKSSKHTDGVLTTVLSFSQNRKLEIVAIEIKINGKISRSPVEYKANELWQKVYEYYIYYYNKYGTK